MMRWLSALLWVVAALLFLLAALTSRGGALTLDLGMPPSTPTAGPSEMRWVCWYSVDERRDKCDWVEVPLAGGR